MGPMLVFSARLWGRTLSLLAVAAALLLPALGGAVRADESAEIPSLKLVPADASFYAVALRGREQVEIVATSNFWKKLSETDVFKQTQVQISLAKDEPDNPLKPFFDALELSENQQALAVVKEMLSDEAFVYGGSGIPAMLEVVNDATNASRFATLLGEIDTGRSVDQRRVATVRATFDSLNANRQRLKVPELVVAFHIKDQDAAEEQLRRIEAYARVLPEHVPDLAPLRGKIKSTRVGDTRFLTLTIDKTVLPWQKVPFEQLAEKPGQYDELRDKLQELKLVVALGIYQDYLVLSLGPSTDHLLAWGKGPALGNHPKLAPLHKKGKQRFTNVSYMSEELAAQSGVQPHDIDQWLGFGEQALSGTKLPEAEQSQILTDARALATQIKASLPKPGARVGFSYLTPQGIETCKSNWSENRRIDGAKSLPVLSHLGKDPLFAVAFRGRYRPENYAGMVEWLAKGRHYFEKYGVPQMSERDQENYKLIGDIAYPMLIRMDKIHRESLLPALADGQAALVIDSQLKAKQWHVKMPATTEETAIPMPALVLGVADAALMEKALGDYRELINDLIKQVRPLAAPDAPEIQLPPAEQKKLDEGGTVYYYALADKLGLNKQLAPNAGLSRNYLVLSLAPRQTVELLKDQPLTAATDGPLAGQMDRPVAAAVVFNFPQLVDLSLPWINEGVREFVRQMEQAIAFNLGDPDEEEIEMDEKPLADSPATLATLAQIKQIGELIKVLRGVTTVTTMEDGVKVTRRQIRFEDVK